MARPGPAWTPKQLRYLQAHYANVRTADLAEKLGRPVAAVYQMAWKLGLKKGPVFHRSAESGRLRPGDDRGGPTRFRPGQKSWNKGTHYMPGGRSVETRFQPGRQPHEAHNYRPIGSLRVSRDGYLERKVTDDQALVPARRWVAVHRLVWEAAHGPIPGDCRVCFLPGRFSTELEQITLDALELVSRSELMRRNTIQRYPPELRQTMQLVGRVRKAIERRTA